MNKYFTIGSVNIIILLYFNCLVFAQYAINDSGGRLFVEAIQNQGANGHIIHSGKITFILSEEKKTDSEEIIQKNVNTYVQHYKEELKNTPKDTKRYNYLTNMLQNRNLIEKECRKTSQKLANTINKYQIIFRGGTPFTDVKQEIFNLSNLHDENIKKDNEMTNEKNVPILKLIGNNVNPFGKSMYIGHNVNAGNTITIESNWAIPLINELGRARGHRFSSFTALFLLGGTQEQMKSFSFNQDFIEQFIALNDDLVKNTKTAGIRITGQRNFEDSFVWILTIPQPTDIRVKRNVNGKTVIWVDPTRGYICPLIEEYVQDICVVRYESSDYYQDKSSGIWFPRKTIDTEFDLVTKEQLRRVTYEIIHEETDFNIPISDDEFVFPIVAGWTVMDKQSGRQNSYRVVRDTKLKFEKGRIALNESRDFIADDVMSSVNLPVSNEWMIRMFCIVIGVVFVLFALFHFRRRTIK
jgi:hypothetical protein